METVIISGGAGGNGKKLIETFANSFSFKEIIVLDNFSSSDINQFLHLQDDLHTQGIHVTLYDFDITHKNMIPFLKERCSQVDCIYHLAKDKSDDSLKALCVGYTGTKQILELAKYYNSKVYYKIRETKKTCDLVTEELCRSYKEHFGLNVESC
jgi:nucleoside-diphosphate-sugar epimerase